MGIHDNHRERLRQRYLQQGADALTDQQLLELYLFYAIPRKDVNPLANALLQSFGSLDGVFSASVQQLTKVPGMGVQGACCIHLLGDLARRREISRNGDPNSRITHWQQAGEYLLPYFFGAVGEQVYLLCLDLRGRVLNCRCISEGEGSFAALDLSTLVDCARQQRAGAVILAHNHPSGSLVASAADVHATLQAKKALAGANITLMDHLIVADEQFASIRRQLPEHQWED